MSCYFLLFFFFRQKTAYEMRISDWSSDVCSSDLQHREEFETFAIVTDSGERKYPFNLRFRPDKRVVQTLKRISGSMGSVRVSFDVSDVAAGVVSYDPRQNALIILNPSDKLKQEIQEYEGDAAD